MKKTFITIALLACVALFSSCTEGFLRELLTGSATTVIGDNEPEEYTSSIVMFSNADTLPFALSLSTAMDVDQLLNLHGPEDITFPLMSYRLVDTIEAGRTYTVNNELTEEDIEEFDYEWLINGKFAHNNIVAIAESENLFYIMSTGSVTLTSMTSSKLTGNFSGYAYVLDREATPKLSEDLVPITGEFTSRIAPVMLWLMDLQLPEELPEIVQE